MGIGKEKGKWLSEMIILATSDWGNWKWWMEERNKRLQQKYEENKTMRRMFKIIWMEMDEIEFRNNFMEESKEVDLDISFR